MEFQLIPAGKFIMGAGDQAHEVTLTKPFKIGVHEVTQTQYEQVMGINPSKILSLTMVQFYGGRSVRTPVISTHHNLLILK
ncbi:SUMF1/EgtB/PvdO family nonheme iron enzyme [bacterium]|nr:SUMF1/EgtB/PvdO family nonheme iron enzyme [bacterium]